MLLINRLLPLRNRERGIVLPVVLVMLLLMTVTVLLLMRRGAVDELLASNVRQVVSMETSAQFALRMCERRFWKSPPGIAPAVGDPDPPPTVCVPPVVGASACARTETDSARTQWREPANDPFWMPLPVTLLGDGVAGARCLIEDASGELELTKPTDPTTAIDKIVPEESWRKFRITVEVRSQAGTFARAQAEVRRNLPPTT